MLWIYDFANALVCIILIVIACRIKIIPLWIGYILGIYSFLPFFINDFLFQAEYMVDQFSYVAVVKEARSLNFLTEIVTSDKYETGIDKNFIAQIDWKTLLTGWSLALLPLPFTETVSSLGFFNRFLFILIFLWLYKKNFLNGISLFFILFYPSFVLYTSLSLRDPLVTSLMIVSVIFLIEKKYLSFLISIAPIYFLKFQNFYIMLALFLIYILFQRETFVYRIRYVLIGLIVIGFTPFVDQIISYMNIVHIGMINENGGTFENYKNYDGIYDLIKNSVFAFPNF